MLQKLQELDPATIDSLTALSGGDVGDILGGGDDYDYPEDEDPDVKIPQPTQAGFIFGHFSGGFLVTTQQSEAMWPNGVSARHSKEREMLLSKNQKIVNPGVCGSNPLCGYILRLQRKNC